MNFSNILRDLNIERMDWFYLSFLLIYSIAISCILINFNESIGIYCSDVYIYLTNSLVFAGIPSITSYMYLSPLICFLTSILFRLGLFNEMAIYIVTGALAIFGNLGIYFLLKSRFNSMLSLFGGILFGSFSLNLLWWANGTLDIPAVSFSIWAMLFLVLAVDKNPKYYLLAFPLLAIGIFTRYTCLFMIPLFFFYFLSKHDFFNCLDLLISDYHNAFDKLKEFLFSEEFKYILKALALALIVVIAFICVIKLFKAPLSFITQGSTFAGGSKGEVIDNAYTTDTLFYLHDFLNFLFSNKVVFDNVIPNLLSPSYLAYLIGGILLIGLIIAGFRFFKERNSNKINQNDSLEINQSISHSKIDFKTKHFKSFLFALLVISSIVGLIGFKINSLITITCLLVDFVIIFSFLKIKGYDRESYSLSSLMLAWFLIYFIFFTFLNIKVNRYIITVFPAFIYFVVLALDEILDSWDGFKSFHLSSLIPALLIILCLVSAFSFTGTFDGDVDFNDEKIVANHLIGHDSDYANKIIASTKQRQFNWWLKDYTIAVRTDQTDFIEENNITYYICDEKIDLKNYKEIYKYNDWRLYERAV